MSVTPDIANAPLCVATQLWLVEYLKSREVFTRGAATVPIIGRREKNLTSDIDAAIDALGACLYVFPMLPLKFNGNVPGPFIDLAEFRIRCIEQDTLNTTLPDCYELVEAVVRELHGLTLTPFAAALSCLLPHPSRPVEPIEDSERIIHDVIFHAQGCYTPRIEEQY